MAQPATNPKIEELRFRLKTDPKSRHFYPLAEELRKVGASGEAESVLRAGIEHHPTYLSAFVCLGRVLKDQGKNDEAVGVLNKALLIDRENVVAARLLGETYIVLGEKVEAIKKFKLVHALLPKDDEIEAIITQLDRELNPVPLSRPESEHGADHESEPVPEHLAAPAASAPPKSHEPPAAATADPFGSEPHGEAAPFVADAPGESPVGVEPPAAAAPAFEEPEPFEEPSPATDDNPFSAAPATPTAVEAVHPFGAGESSLGGWSLDDEPVVASPPQEPVAEPDDELVAEPVSDTPSPFNEPSGYTADAFEIEHPRGMSISSEPSPWIEDDELPPSIAAAVAAASPEPPPAVEEETPWNQDDDYFPQRTAVEIIEDENRAREATEAVSAEPEWRPAELPAEAPEPWETSLTHRAEELWASEPAAPPDEEWHSESSIRPEDFAGPDDGGAAAPAAIAAHAWNEPAPAADDSDVFAAPPAALDHELPQDALLPDEPAEPPQDEITNTITMADLYARQGLVDDARHVYERMLRRDPENEAVREKLGALSPLAADAPHPADPSRLRAEKQARLERWLAKVRQESGHV